MYSRLILNELSKWKESSSRKPLILRGARQTGKTTAINLFAQNYSQYIYLNLEKSADAGLFSQLKTATQLAESVFFLKQKNWQQRHETLLFIDEIQQSPEAIGMLRYFYEDLPELHVIAAGSLLETVLNEKINIPVGRVEYRVLRPVSFHEFLLALNETAAAEALTTFPFREIAHEKLLELFHSYAFMGGMPEIVKQYAEHRDITALSTIYESLLVSYLDDVEQYARNSTMVQVIRHCIRSAFAEAGKRITFSGFGQSNYQSREVSESLRVLEKVMLLQMVYPATVTSPPLLGDKRKKPRLQVLDTGLMNYFAGLQQGIIGTSGLNEIYSGRIAEHLAGQELLSVSFSVLKELCFWTREKKDAEAEIDFILPYENLLIPVEVKSGVAGKLRSLQQFMELCPHNLAIRLYNGKINIHTAKTPSGKEFYLLNLPYYLASQLTNFVTWFLHKKNNE
jgi:predicted AAA+ superfamily ATPase